MNVKLITKALHTLSLLSEEDVTTVMNLRALSEDERELLVTVLEPQKTTEKRAGKKSGKGGSKSPRASGMAAAINRSLSQQRQVVKDGSPCFATVDDNGGEMTCGKMEDDPAHDTRYLSSHPFVRDSRAAQPARGRSSTNGGAGSTTQNIETGADVAQDVAASSS